MYAEHLPSVVGEMIIGLHACNLMSLGVMATYLCATQRCLIYQV